LITIIALFLGVQLLRALFQQYVHGLLRMAETLRLMLGANRNFRVHPEGPPEVRELARAVNALAQQRDELLDDVEGQIRLAKVTVEEEKNRLAALMSELALGVVVCNLDGRILLYNSRARLQFKALAQGPTSMSGWRPDRARPLDLLDTGAWPDHAFAGEHPATPAQGQRRADGELHHHHARGGVVALSDGSGARLRRAG
jgi:PAS domain-containing protein